jgi:hypothetical protein
VVPTCHWLRAWEEAERAGGGWADWWAAARAGRVGGLVATACWAGRWAAARWAAAREEKEKRPEGAVGCCCVERAAGPDRGRARVG